MPAFVDLTGKRFDRLLAVSRALDRVDPTGDYEPSNCRWASWEVQRSNKRRNHVQAN